MTRLRRPLRVLAQPAFKFRERNPYNWLLSTSLQAAGAQVCEFSKAELFRGGHDLWHLHWPEGNLNSPVLGRALRRSAGLLGLIQWSRARGTKIVWTIHNLAAHERLHPRLERWFWDIFIRQLDGHISLSRAGQELALERFPRLRLLPGFVIPHGHYRAVYPNNVAREAAREVLGIVNDATVLLYLGQIRRYKNVPALIEMFRTLQIPKILLLVAGQPADPALERAVHAATAGDGRVRLALSFLPGEDLQLYMNAADLVVLPYSEILNSGSAILGLSFDRPVLVPAKGALNELQDLVGPAWVRTFEGALSAGALAEAVSWVRTSERAQHAPTEALCWDSVSQATVAAYEAIRTGRFADEGS